MRRSSVTFAVVVAACWTATPVAGATPRELLTQASFGDRDKAVALGRVQAAHREASATVASRPADDEARLMQATAVGYRAKLTGSRSDAVTARRQFEALIASDPRNAEAQLALGAWHVGAVYRLGGLVARAALGAQKSAGLSALDRSVALAGDRALFSGIAGMLRLELDPADGRGRALVERAARGDTPTPLDRIMQRAAAAILAPLRAGNASAVRKLAALSLPMGRVAGIE